MYIKCSNCGHEIVNGSEFCGNCSAKIVQPPQQQPTQQTQQVQQQEPQPIMQAPNVNVTTPTPQATAQERPSAYAVSAKKSSKVSLIAMIFGILSVFTWLILVGGLLGIVAVVLGIIGLNKGGKGYAITGIVTGVISIILTVALLVYGQLYCNDNDNLSKEVCKDSIKSKSIIDQGEEFQSKR